MREGMPDQGAEVVRVEDLELLDLSDLVRLDDDWRRTLVLIARLHLALFVVLAVIVVAYARFARGLAAPLDMAGAVIVLLSLAGMAWLVFSAANDEKRILGNLRFVVLLSILTVSVLVLLLRDLQGDYYLLYFLPLVSAAGYLGFIGGMFAGIASALAYVLVFALSPVSFSPGAVSALVLRMLVFVLVGSLLGLIAERHLSLMGALRAAHKQAVQLAITDTKTGLFNTAYLEARLPGEISRAQRSSTPLAFLVLDVNGLEQINREHGYAAGDAVLQGVGETIRKQLRASDIPSRWGVDEFGILLYNTDADGAAVVAQRMANEISEFDFTDPSTGHSFSATVTQGIASFPAGTQDRSGKELLDRAYQAMRRAKSGEGIVIWGNS